MRFSSSSSSSESRLCDWLVVPVGGRPLKFGQKNSQTFCRNLQCRFCKTPFNLGGGLCWYCTATFVFVFEICLQNIENWKEHALGREYQNCMIMIDAIISSPALLKLLWKAHALGREWYNCMLTINAIMWLPVSLVIDYDNKSDGSIETWSSSIKP